MMWFVAAGALVFCAAGTLLVVCMCKSAAEGDENMRRGLKCRRGCGLPVYADGLCEPCWEIGRDEPRGGGR